MTPSRPRVLVVGGGFAGFHALRRLEKLLPPDAAELALVNPTDYLLYSPAAAGRHRRPAGAAARRRLAAPAPAAHPAGPRPGHRRRRGRGDGGVDLLGDGGSVSRTISLDWDRLVLVPGSVTRQFDIPGVAERAHGVKTLIEARYLRDHLLTQLDRADVLADTPEGRAEREQRLTVVAVGAG
jgi:NADH dehydrogenase